SHRTPAATPPSQPRSLYSATATPPSTPHAVAPRTTPHPQTTPAEPMATPGPVPWQHAPTTARLSSPLPPAPPSLDPSLSLRHRSRPAPGTRQTQDAQTSPPAAPPSTPTQGMQPRSAPANYVHAS